MESWSPEVACRFQLMHCHAELHSFLKKASFTITPSLIYHLNLTQNLDPKVLALANGSSALLLSSVNTPEGALNSLVCWVAFSIIMDKLWHRSPKPLSQLLVSTTIHTIYSFIPTIAVKLALYAIRKNPSIDMEDRKERALYIISTIALTALLTPHFLKIHRKTYLYTALGLAEYSATQIAVHLGVAEIFAWDAEKITEQLSALPSEAVLLLPPEHRAISSDVTDIMDRKIREAQDALKQALVFPERWRTWMDKVPIEIETTHLPHIQNAVYAEFIANNPELLSRLPTLVQLDWNVMFYLESRSQVWPIPLSADHIALIEENPQVFHQYFSTTPFFFLLESNERARINGLFIRSGQDLQQIEETFLDNFSLIITNPKHPYFWSQSPHQKEKLFDKTLTQMHQFFSMRSENAPEKYRWKALPFLEKVEYNGRFQQLGLPSLPYT